MFIIWGTGSEAITLAGPETSYCSVCERDRSFWTRLIYTYHHEYYIFAHVKAQEYWRLCEICNRGVRLDQGEMERRLGGSPIPFMRRHGSTVLVCGFLVLFVGVIGSTVALNVVEHYRIARGLQSARPVASPPPLIPRRKLPEVEIPRLPKLRDLDPQIPPERLVPRVNPLDEFPDAFGRSPPPDSIALEPATQLAPGTRIYVDRVGSWQLGTVVDERIPNFVTYTLDGDSLQWTAPRRCVRLVKE